MDFIEKYKSAAPEARVDIILDYYQNFPAIIEGQQKVLIRRLKNERDYIRQKRKVELGIRIQDFGLSDPTAREAIEMVGIEKAVVSGEGMEDLFSEMDQVETDLLCRNFYVLRKMKEEYELINNSLMLLSNWDRNTFKLYVENNCDIHRLAAIEGIQEESAGKRIWRLRKRIKDETVGSMIEDL